MNTQTTPKSNKPVEQEFTAEELANIHNFVMFSERYFNDLASSTHREFFKEGFYMGLIQNNPSLRGKFEVYFPYMESRTRSTRSVSTGPLTVMTKEFFRSLAK